MKWLEILIPVPWGYIAGKTWGNETDEPVLAIHGYQDNANTFNRLVPFLPETFYYICLDLPNHGKSSHLPSKTSTTFLDFLVAIKLAIDYLNRKKYILMGHSLGGHMVTWFTILYPEYVTKLISLDATLLVSLESKDFKNYFREQIETGSKLGNLNSKLVPTYTFDEVVRKIRLGRNAYFINDDSIKTLTKRSIIPVENDKYKISTSQTMKNYLRIPFTPNYCVELLKKFPITCSHIVIFTNNHEGNEFKCIREEFKRNNKFRMYFVKAGHYVHLDRPEIMLPMLKNFLLENRSKL